MSAPRASETDSTANPFLGSLVASPPTVQVSGSPATYANRASLRDLGLRWDPTNHGWHGTATAAAVMTFREELHFEVRVFGVLEGAPKSPNAPKPTPLRPAPLSTTTKSSPCDPPRDYSRTRFESRLAFPGADDDDAKDTEEFVIPAQRFTLLETTSDLPDDSRGEDERQEERRIHELRARVKAASATVPTTSGLAETLSRDWWRARMFYTRYSITEEIFRYGVPSSPGSEPRSLTCSEQGPRGIL